MTTQLDELFERNRRWAATTELRSPGFFTRLLAQRNRNTCGSAAPTAGAGERAGQASSRQAVSCIRNVANVVAHGDLSCLSVIQFAADVLQVRHHRRRPFALRQGDSGAPGSPRRLVDN